MKDRACALLVYDQEDPLSDLSLLLDRLGIESLRARSCAEARLLLASPMTLHLAFTHTELPDGSWAETVNFAARIRRPVPVIVVSSTLDRSLCLDSLETGAAEFIVPPFRDADLAYVVEGALLGLLFSPARSALTPTEMTPDTRNRAGTKKQGIEYLFQGGLR
jgi:DNA-binding NtrC family response regulator